MKKIIKLTESELIRVVKRVINEQPISPVGFTHKLVSVTKKGPNVVGITSPTSMGGQNVPTRWDGCKKDGTSNCIEYPSMLSDGKHSATEGTCNTCDFFINYMGSKYLCHFNDKPCKKIS